jgi:transcriptional regulator with XRE-family HTH domain
MYQTFKSGFHASPLDDVGAIFSEPARPTGRQIAAARVLSGMTQAELAIKSLVSTATLRRMEACKARPISGNEGSVRAICKALEAAGIELLSKEDGGLGVKARDSNETWASSLLDLLQPPN